ncbi:Ca(2+)-dependent cysteine protease [Linderina pennispora]|nr:Ca(2+)-dependent cysteine protease [Linderina pennispora]
MSPQESHSLASGGTAVSGHNQGSRQNYSPQMAGSVPASNYSMESTQTATYGPGGERARNHSYQVADRPREMQEQQYQAFQHGSTGGQVAMLSNSLGAMALGSSPPPHKGEYSSPPQNSYPVHAAPVAVKAPPPPPRDHHSPVAQRFAAAAVGAPVQRVLPAVAPAQPPLPPTINVSVPTNTSMQMVGNASADFSASAYEIAHPLWNNISATEFHAYEHTIQVAQSNLTGNKYALIVGINYYNAVFSQQANINRAHQMKDFLMTRFGYLDQNILLLSDDQQDDKKKPTHDNIRGGIKRLMKNVKPNDSAFVYYCGFSEVPRQIRSNKSDVVQRLMRKHGEYILPSDFQGKGSIDASYLHDKLVGQLPPGARLTLLLDCILKDTGINVPYKYTAKGVPMVTSTLAGNNLIEASYKMNANKDSSMGDLSQRYETSVRQEAAKHNLDEIERLQRGSGDIIVIGWSRDPHHENYKSMLHQAPNNELSNHFAGAYVASSRQKPNVTLRDIMAYISNTAAKAGMVPFIASGRKLSMDEELAI